MPKAQLNRRVNRVTPLTARHEFTEVKERGRERDIGVTGLDLEQNKMHQAPTS